MIKNINNIKYYISSISYFFFPFSIVIYFFGNIFDLIATYKVYITNSGIELNILYNTLFNHNMYYFLIFKFIFSIIFLYILVLFSNRYINKNYIFISFLLFIMGLGFIYLGFLNLSLIK